MRIKLEFSEPVFQREFFIKQSGEKPVREKVQPDVRTDAEFVSAVVPGFKFFFGQKHPGYKFTGKNEQGIETAAQGEP